MLFKKNIIEIKKSKFISYYFNVTDVNEINDILNKLKKEHKKAVHFPYAYKINNQEKKTDDKEPTNTAGLPIYNIIKQKKLNNVLIVVVRYFGGIKLGTGGLYRAYQRATLELLK